jgi:hypothetical protein
MTPGSPAQQFEQRLAQLNNEIDEVVEFAKDNPAITAQQDPRVQLLLSGLLDLRREVRPSARVVSFRR